MTIMEQYVDIFTIPKTIKDKKVYLAHCVSADLAMGAGIAVQFNKEYHIKETLDIYWPDHPEILNYPSCFMVDRVFNLVTKERYWHKPTYATMEAALHKLADLCKKHDAKYLAMPRIGCGLDKLSWPSVKMLIHNAFSGMDINIFICVK